MVIEGYGLNPLEFEWLEEDSEEYIDGEGAYFRVSRLRHRLTDYLCKFGGLRIEFSPGNADRVETGTHGAKWIAKLYAVDVWLAELRKEIDAPDLWATIGQERVLSTAASSAHIDNRPFTAVEQKVIGTKLDEIKAYLDGQQFAADEASLINREIAYLRESAGRFGPEGLAKRLVRWVDYRGGRRCACA